MTKTIKISLSLIGGILLVASDLFKKIKIALSIILGYAIYLIGDVDKFIKLLSLFILIDIVTGFIKAIFNKDLNSKKMFIGGYKKILIYVIIMIGNAIDGVFTDLFLRQAIVIYYIIQEGTSIIENVNTYIDLPPALVGFFKELKDEEKGDNNNEN